MPGGPYILFWKHEMRIINMGKYATKQQAIFAIDTAKQDLLNQCPRPHIETNLEYQKARDDILKGEWHIINIDGETVHHETHNS